MENKKLECNFYELNVNYEQILNENNKIKEE